MWVSGLLDHHGLYVLVDAGKIIRVVPILYLHKAFVVVAVGRLDALLAFVHHEVHVCPTTRVWMQGVPVLRGPEIMRPLFAESGSTPTMTWAQVAWLFSATILGITD